LTLAYVLHKKFNVPDWFMLLILFMGVGLLIHIIYDIAADPKVNFIKYYIDMQPSLNIPVLEKLRRVWSAMHQLINPAISS
jgi:hypothetical protein